MSLETGSYISDLNVSNPASGDPKSQGDDQIRLIKLILKLTFPAFSGPMPIAHDQIASKDLLFQTAFSTAMPAQPGGPLPYAMTSVNGSAGWKRSDIYSDNERLAQAQATALCF